MSLVLVVAIASLCLFVLIFWGGEILEFLLCTLLFVIFGGIGLLCSGVSLYLQAEMGRHGHHSYFILFPILGLLAFLVAWHTGKSCLLRLLLLPPVIVCIWHFYVELIRLLHS